MHLILTTVLVLHAVLLTGGDSFSSNYQPSNPCSSADASQATANQSGKDPRAFQFAASTWSACANSMPDTDPQKCLYVVESASDYGAAASLAENEKIPALAVQMYLSSYGHYHIAKGICSGRMSDVIDQGLELTEAGIYRTGPSLGLDHKKPAVQISPTPAPEAPSAL